MLRTGTFFLMLPLLLPFLVTTPSLNAQNVVAENIFFLKEDGMNYLNYYTIRSNLPSYGIWFDKKRFPSPEQAFKDTLYFYPPNYTWDTTKQKYLILRVPQGSYAKLDMGRFIPGSAVRMTEDGDFIYSNWDGQTRGPDGHYGFWNTPVDYKQYVYVWVVPANIEIIKYDCNRDGRWIKRGNTIAFYGTNVNDLVFTIRYRLKNQDVFNVIKRDIQKLEGIEVSQSEEGVKVTMGATVLFASGSSDLSGDGKHVLDRLVRSLISRQNIKIIVSGHTDDRPIPDPLKDTYPTNWELSSARALTVLHYLHVRGIEENRLEMRAFGSTRPVAPNDTPEGRARNRRIEILIQSLEGMH